MEHAPKLLSFVADEDGAVSIDWVVLTASIVAIGVVVGSNVNSIPGEVTGDVQAYATSVDPVTGTVSTE